MECKPLGLPASLKALHSSINQLMNPIKKREEQRLSRRQALKTLAVATGVMTLSNLPEQWQSPLVELGHLPAHAQGSPTNAELIIYDLSISDAQGVCDPGTGDPGDLFAATFRYRDETSGSVLPDISRARAVYTFDDGRSHTDEVTLDSINITGDGKEGKIVVPLCVGFGSADRATVALTITNNQGTRSNVEDDRVNKP